MLSIALTGSLCSGKTTVCTYLAKKYRIPYVSADHIVHTLQRSGTSCYRRIIKTFGRDVVRADGRLNRPALRALIFSDVQARKRLERIVHPAVIDKLRQAGRFYQKMRKPAVLMEIPLLFETGLEKEFDAVIVVDAPLRQLQNRVQKKFGVSRTEALRRIRAQIDPRLKRKRADYIIKNTKTLTIVKREADVVWQKIRKRIR